MENVLKSDIFFTVTTVAVVLLTLALLIAVFYIIRILRNVEDVSETVREESKHLKDDLDDVRQGIRGAIPTFIRKLFGLKRSTRRKIKS